MVRSFDVKSILRPISVKPEHQLAFVEGGRKIAHDLQANFTIDMVMTPCVAENNDVEDILKLVGRCSWKNHTGKVMLPWEEAYQRGQLVKRLDHLGDQSGLGQKMRNRGLLQHKLGLDTDKPLRNYALLSTELFEPYPVFLLQWKGRPAELPTSWNSLTDNRLKIVEFIKEHPDLEEFYKGESCSTTNIMSLIVARLRRPHRKCPSYYGPDRGDRSCAAACSQQCGGPFRSRIEDPI